MAAVRQVHPFWGNYQIEWAMEAASLPRAPPAVEAPMHTQHTGQHGDDGLVEPIPWSRLGEASEPPPHSHRGPGPRIWRKVHIALVEGQHRDAPLACTVGLTNWEPTDPRMPVWPYRLNRETR